MKKFSLIILCLLLAQAAFAQDLITKVDGEEIKARVLEITLDEVIYQATDSLEGKHYSIAKKDVFMVVFANGTREVFQENLPEGTHAYDPAKMFFQGQQDARQYYDGRGAMWGSAASVLVIGPFGPVVMAAVKPKARKNANLPANLLQGPNYIKGYEKQAHKRKAGKTAIGAGIGIAAMAVYLVIAGGSAQ